MVPNHKATSRMILSDHLGLQHPALGLNPFLWVWQYLFLGPGICRGEIVQEIVLPDALFSGLTWEKLSCELNMETPCSSGKSQLSVCLYYMGIITGMIGNLSVYLRRLFTCISSISLLWCVCPRREGAVHVFFTPVSWAYSTSWNLGEAWQIVEWPDELLQIQKATIAITKAFRSKYHFFLPHIKTNTFLMSHNKNFTS